MIGTPPASTVVSRVLLLKRFPMFADLSPAALTPLAERVVEASAASGEAVLREDGEAGCVHFVLEGTVEVRRLGFAMGTLGAGEVLGDIDALSAAPASLTTARAVESCRTLQLSRADLLAAQEDCFPLQRALLRRIGAAGLRARERLGWGVAGAGGDDPAAAEPIGDANELAHRVASLRSCRELARLRIRSLGRLAVAARIESHQPGGTVWRCGDRAVAAIHVMRGRVQCIVPDAETFEVGCPTLLGLPETLAEQPRWCDAVAASDVVVMRLGAEEIFDELEDDADVAAELIASLAAETAALEDRIARSGAIDPEGS